MGSAASLERKAGWTSTMSIYGILRKVMRVFQYTHSIRREKTRTVTVGPVARSRARRPDQPRLVDPRERREGGVRGGRARASLCTVGSEGSPGLGCRWSSVNPLALDPCVLRKSKSSNSLRGHSGSGTSSPFSLKRGWSSFIGLQPGNGVERLLCRLSREVRPLSGEARPGRTRRGWTLPRRPH